LPFALILPVLLRLAGPIAFVLAALSAGVMNRSAMIIPLLAVAATLTTVLVRKFSPSPALNLQAMLNPQASTKPESIFKGLLPRFGAGLVGYGLAFGFAALVAALFQVTEFEPRLLVTDTAFLIVPAILACFGAYMSAQMGLNQMANMAGQMQSMFSDIQAQQAANDESGDAPFTFEGEVIDPDDDAS